MVRPLDAAVVQVNERYGDAPHCKRRGYEPRWRRQSTASLDAVVVRASMEPAVESRHLDRSGNCARLDEGGLVVDTVVVRASVEAAVERVPWDAAS